MPNGQTEAKKKRKVRATRLQKRTIQILKDNPGMSKAEAMRRAGYAKSTSTHPKQKLVESKGAQVEMEKWREQLRGSDLGEKALLNKYREHLEAQKVVSARITSKDADSQTDDFIDVPDYQAQARAVEWIRKDLGVDSGLKVEHGATEELQEALDRIAKIIK